MKSTFVMLVQILVMVVLATVLALVWNGVSGQGLTLGKNNFRRGVQPVSHTDTQPQVDPGTTGNGGNGEPDNGGSEPSEEPPAHGLQVMTVDDVEVFVELAPDDDTVLILDARNIDNYEEGRMPHAVHLDHFRSDQMIEGLRDRLDAAQTIIVYCGGGDCEDSINLASTLITDFGYDYNLIYVYEGGIEEWEKTGHTVVKGS